MARIDVLVEALKQFDALPKPMQFRVERLVERLARWPEVSGVKSLSGDLSGLHRVRSGDYRVQFRVQRLARRRLAGDCGENWTPRWVLR